MMEADAGVSTNQDSWQPGWEPGRGKEESSPRALRRSMALLMPGFHNSSLWNYKRTKFCFFCCSVFIVFKSLSLWYFVTAALESQCSGYIPRCRMYWVGQNIYSGFSKTSWGKIRTNFFANLIQFFQLLAKAAAVLESVQKLKLKIQLGVDVRANQRMKGGS